MKMMEIAPAAAQSIIDTAKDLQFAIDPEAVKDDDYYLAVMLEIQNFVCDVQVALDKLKAETDTKLLELAVKERQRLARIKLAEASS
jgi:hypothetical protein